MSRTRELSIHDVIKPLYYFSRIFYLWSYRYGRDYGTTPLTLIDKTVAFIISTAITLWCCWATLLEYQEQKATDLIVLGLVYILFTHVLAVYSIILTNFGYDNLTQTFFLELDRIHKLHSLFSSSDFYKFRKKLCLQIALFLSVNLITDAMDLIYIITGSSGSFLEYAGAYFTKYALILLFLQLTCKAKLLGHYFSFLNERLKKCVPLRCQQSESIIEVSGGFGWEPQEIKLISQSHDSLCGLIQLINEVRGWQMIIATCTLSVFLLILVYMRVVVKIDDEGNIANDIDTGDKVIQGILDMKEIISTLSHCIQAILVARNCSFARKEAVKTGILANKMLQEMQTDTGKSGEMCKSHLEFLVQQISYTSPEFTAKGIFALDYTLISTVIGAVTSYFIVFLQFRATTTCNCYCVNNGTNYTT